MSSTPILWVTIILWRYGGWSRFESTYQYRAIRKLNFLLLFEVHLVIQAVISSHSHLALNFMNCNLLHSNY